TNDKDVGTHGCRTATGPDDELGDDIAVIVDDQLQRRGIDEATKLARLRELREQSLPSDCRLLELKYLGYQQRCIELDVFEAWTARERKTLPVYVIRTGQSQLRGCLPVEGIQLMPPDRPARAFNPGAGFKVNVIQRGTNSVPPLAGSAQF